MAGDFVRKNVTLLPFAMLKPQKKSHGSNLASSYSCCASPTCILVTVSFLSSGQSVFHRNVGSENHIIKFASDSLFRLDDVGSEEYNKILLTHIHLGFKLCTLMPEDGRG
jgi:hypothetical protein